MSALLLDLNEIDSVVASNTSLRVGQLPAHITATKEGLGAFLALFGEVTLFGLVESIRGGEAQPDVLVRFQLPRAAVNAKACLEQLRIGKDRALDVGWLHDDHADAALENLGVGWYEVEHPRRQRRREPRAETQSAPAASPVVAGGNAKLDFVAPTAVTTAMRNTSAAEATAVGSATAAARPVVAESADFAFVVCLLQNMFSPEEERAANGPEWAAELQAEIEGEVAALRPEAVIVDDWTAKGRVLIRFGSEQVARRCSEGMQARVFGGRIVESHVISLSQAETILRGRG